MPVSNLIFKAYDIRGVVPTEVNADVGHAVGRAFAPFLKKRYGVKTPQVVLGQDVRLSSPEIARAASRGLVEAGANVIDVGLTTTPMHYWIIGTGKADGGIMVTASHLGKEYNGMKLSGREAEPFAEADGFPELRALMAKPSAAGRGQGSVERRDYLPEYVSFLAAQASPSELTLVVDASSGAAGVVLAAFFRRFPQLAVSPLNFEPDGNFPHHDPNPMRDDAILQVAALAPHADLGVIFDGDADRVFFLDEGGRRIPADIITALIAERILSRSPGEAIIYNPPSSRTVRETIERHGGKPIAARTGHYFMKRAMREFHAVFGGEHSGHFYFRKTFCAENSILAMLAALEILGSQARPFSEVIRPYEKYARSGELNFPLRDWTALKAGVEATFRGADFDELDGLTAEASAWRFNLRPSNTEPVIRLNAEARNEETLQELIATLSRIIQSA